MAWLVLTRALPREVRQQMIDKGILLEEGITINEPQEALGWAFPDVDKNAVKSILKIPNDAHESIYPTDLPNVNLLVWGESVRGTVRARSGKNREVIYPGNVKEIREMLQQEASDLDTNIEVIYPRARGLVSGSRYASPPQKKTDTVFIHIHAVPFETGFSRTPLGSVFGAKIPEETPVGALVGKNLLLPSKTGFLIQDEQADPKRAVAEVTDHNIYILFNIDGVVDNPGGFSASSRAASWQPAARSLKRILDEAVPLALNFSPDKVKEIESNRRKTQRELAKKSYAQECARRLSSEQSELEERIAKDTERVNKMRSDLVTLSQSVNDSLRRLNSIKSGNDEAFKKFEQEFEKLADMPLVNIIEVSKGMITIFTYDIIINYEGRRYKIGDFRIDIDTNGNSVSITNLHNTGGVSGIDHPHISGGHCCFGNIEQGVTECLTDNEYAYLVELLLSFLQSYYPQSSYAPISSWPRV